MFLLGYHAQAQQNCADILKNAEKNFDDGKIFDVFNLLQPCIENGFSKADKIRAYKLIILSDLYADDIMHAEKYIVKLLLLDPDQELDYENDPKEYINLMEQFRRDPIYSIGAVVGPNLSFVYVTQPNNLDTSLKSYTPKLSFNFGITTEFLIKKGWQFGAEAHFLSLSYAYTDTKFGFASSKYSENLSYLSIPLMLKKEFGAKRFKLYTSLGFNSKLLLSSKSSSTRTQFAGNTFSVEDLGIKQSRLRKRFVFEGLIGIGIKQRVGPGSLIIDSKFNLALSNTIKLNQLDKAQSNDTDARPILWSSYHIDDLLTLNYFSINIGYSYPFYNPKKLKRKK